MGFESGLSSEYRVPGFVVPKAGARSRGFALQNRLLPVQLNAALPPLLQQFRERAIVVLAPHYDDACFSLGGFLKAIGHGVVINIFTETLYTARGFAPQPLNRAQVSAIRDAEDRNFARRCGLMRENLGCEEPNLRGRRPYDLGGLDDDLAQITDPLLTALYKRAGRVETTHRAAMFVPLAVGGHINHVAVREAVLRDFNGLSQFFDIFFYEDQSYSRSLLARLRALDDIGRRLDASISARYVFAAPWKEKRDLIALYPSQLRKMPGRLRYWPRAVAPLKPHEAFWTFPFNGAAVRPEKI